MLFCVAVQACRFLCHPWGYRLAGEYVLISILIADDHNIVRAGLRTLLNAEQDLEVIGEARMGHKRCCWPGNCSLM